MEPACSWRVSSHVPRPRGGWALAARTRGRAREGSRPLGTVRRLPRGPRAGRAGRGCPPGAVFGIVVTASLRVSCPPRRAGGAAEGSNGPHRASVHPRDGVLYWRVSASLNFREPFNCLLLLLRVEDLGQLESAVSLPSDLPSLSTGLQEGLSTAQSHWLRKCLTPVAQEDGLLSKMGSQPASWK
ncbi:uncharacterized protein LOC102911807 [Peromyscus maniculatus bairdii]|uniref:uncharacterized protein LOC102911807 n=1 Tax=Peromyscus maniculatus bairdii TaxID=230844 RepID=UPI003FCF0200